jgi:hypothetical protein
VPQAIEPPANAGGGYVAPSTVDVCTPDDYQAANKWSDWQSLAIDPEIYEIYVLPCADNVRSRVNFWYIGGGSGWTIIESAPPSGYFEQANITGASGYGVLKTLLGAVNAPTPEAAGVLAGPTSTPVVGPNCQEVYYSTDGTNTPIVHELGWSDVRTYAGLPYPVKFQVTTCGGADTRLIVQVWLRHAERPYPTSWFYLSTPVLEAIPVQYRYGTFFKVTRPSTCATFDLTCVEFQPWQ